MYFRVQPQVSVLRSLYSAVSLPGLVASGPTSEVDFWTTGRGANTPQRSTAPPALSPPPPPMSTLLLELTLASELVLLNQPLHKTTNYHIRAKVSTEAGQVGICSSSPASCITVI